MNPNQAAFVRAYANTGNATKAAILAGYSPKTARQIGWRLLHQPGIWAAIEATNADRAAVAHYDLAAALADVERGMALAERFQDFGAMAVFTNLKLHLTGHLEAP